MKHGNSKETECQRIAQPGLILLRQSLGKTWHVCGEELLYLGRALSRVLERA